MWPVLPQLPQLLKSPINMIRQLNRGSRWGLFSPDPTLLVHHPLAVTSSLPDLSGLPLRVHTPVVLDLAIREPVERYGHKRKRLPGRDTRERRLSGVRPTKGPADCHLLPFRHYILNRALYVRGGREHGSEQFACALQTTRPARR